MARICNWTTSEGRCGAPATHHHEGQVDGAFLSVELCNTHEIALREMLLVYGFGVEEVLPTAKSRRKHTAASGDTFTETEARAWLIAHGHILPSSVSRLSRTLLKQYADSH